MEFVMGIGCLALAALYFAREFAHEEELKASYEKGYKDGLYQNVIRISSSDEED